MELFKLSKKTRMLVDTVWLFMDGMKPVGLFRIAGVKIGAIKAVLFYLMM
jgi:hypothetical protein